MHHSFVVKMFWGFAVQDETSVLHHTHCPGLHLAQLLARLSRVVLGFVSSGSCPSGIGAPLVELPSCDSLLLFRRKVEDKITGVSLFCDR